MNYHDNRKLIMFFEELTFTYFSGEMWLILTSDSSKNIINVILLEWNLITFPPSCPKYTKMEKIKTFYTVVKGATNFCTVRLFQPKFDLYLLRWTLKLLGWVKSRKILKLYRSYLCVFFNGTVLVEFNCPCHHIWPGFYGDRDQLVFGNL